ncbi:MAG: exosortase-associated EpsI family protein [Chthoniobacterales bacterium]|nr:exosortase-associated EpsI family protein [Chthoniobacterales bacterium]
MRSRPLSFAVAAPVLTAAMLLVITSQRPAPVDPEKVEPYHVAAKAAVESVPYVVGYWNGRDQEVTTAAQRLLRPNAILSRSYVEKHPGDSRQYDRTASLLIVQCGDARDMLGHYPPICYRTNGMKPILSEQRQWTVDGMRLDGMEYQFTQRDVGQTMRTTVYNFFVVPDPDAGPGEAQYCIKRDMDAVRHASENFQTRAYGATQFQVVFSGVISADLSRQERDEVFVTLMQPVIPVIRTLALPSQAAPDSKFVLEASFDKISPTSSNPEAVGGSTGSDLEFLRSPDSTSQSQPGGLP